MFSTSSNNYCYADHDKNQQHQQNQQHQHQQYKKVTQQSTTSAAFQPKPQSQPQDSPYVTISSTNPARLISPSPTITRIDSYSKDYSSIPPPSATSVASATNTPSSSCSYKQSGTVIVDGKEQLEIKVVQSNKSPSFSLLSSSNPYSLSQRQQQQSYLNSYQLGQGSQPQALSQPYRVIYSTSTVNGTNGSAEVAGSSIGSSSYPYSRYTAHSPSYIHAAHTPYKLSQAQSSSYNQSATNNIFNRNHSHNRNSQNNNFQQTFGSSGSGDSKNGVGFSHYDVQQQEKMTTKVNEETISTILKKKDQQHNKLINEVHSKSSISSSAGPEPGPGSTKSHIIAASSQQKRSQQQQLIIKQKIQEEIRMLEQKLATQANIEIHYHQQIQNHEKERNEDRGDGLGDKTISRSNIIVLDNEVTNSANLHHHIHHHHGLSASIASSISNSNHSAVQHHNISPTKSSLILGSNIPSSKTIATAAPPAAMHRGSIVHQQCQSLSQPPSSDCYFCHQNVHNKSRSRGCQRGGHNSKKSRYYCDLNGYSNERIHQDYQQHQSQYQQQQQQQQDGPHQCCHHPHHTRSHHYIPQHPRQMSTSINQNLNQNSSCHHRSNSSDCSSNRSHFHDDHSCHNKHTQPQYDQQQYIDHYDEYPVSMERKGRGVTFNANNAERNEVDIDKTNNDNSKQNNNKNYSKTSNKPNHNPPHFPQHQRVCSVQENRSLSWIDPVVANSSFKHIDDEKNNLLEIMQGEQANVAMDVNVQQCTQRQQQMSRSSGSRKFRQNQRKQQLKLQQHTRNSTAFNSNRNDQPCNQQSNNKSSPKLTNKALLQKSLSKQQQLSEHVQALTNKIDKLSFSNNDKLSLSNNKKRSFQQGGGQQLHFDENGKSYRNEGKIYHSNKSHMNNDNDDDSKSNNKDKAKGQNKDRVANNKQQQGMLQKLINQKYAQLTGINKNSPKKTDSADQINVAEMSVKHDKSSNNLKLKDNLSVAADYYIDANNYCQEDQQQEQSQEKQYKDKDRKHYQQEAKNHYKQNSYNNDLIRQQYQALKQQQRQQQSYPSLENQQELKAKYNNNCNKHQNNNSHCQQQDFNYHQNHKYENQKSNASKNRVIKQSSATLHHKRPLSQFAPVTQILGSKNQNYRHNNKSKNHGVHRGHESHGGHGGYPQPHHCNSISNKKSLVALALKGNYYNTCKNSRTNKGTDQPLKNHYYDAPSTSRSVKSLKNLNHSRSRHNQPHPHVSKNKKLAKSSTTKTIKVVGRADNYDKDRSQPEHRYQLQQQQYSSTPYHQQIQFFNSSRGNKYYDHNHPDNNRLSSSVQRTIPSPRKQYLINSNRTNNNHNQPQQQQLQQQQPMREPHQQLPLSSSQEYLNNNNNNDNMYYSYQPQTYQPSQQAHQQQQYWQRQQQRYYDYYGENNKNNFNDSGSNNIHHQGYHNRIICPVHSHLPKHVVVVNVINKRTKSGGVRGEVSSSLSRREIIVGKGGNRNRNGKSKYKYRGSYLSSTASASSLKQHKRDKQFYHDSEHRNRRHQRDHLLESYRQQQQARDHLIQKIVSIEKASIRKSNDNAHKKMLNSKEFGQKGKLAKNISDYLLLC